MQVTIPLREQQSHSNLSFEFILQFLSSFPEESSACFPLDQDHWGFSSLSTPSTHAILSVFHRQRNKPAQDSVILFMFPSSSTRSSFIWAFESSSGEYLLRLRQRRPGMRDGKEDKAWTCLRNSKTRGKEGTLVMKVHVLVSWVTVTELSWKWIRGNKRHRDSPFIVLSSSSCKLVAWHPSSKYGKTAVFHQIHQDALNNHVHSTPAVDTFFA